MKWTVTAIALLLAASCTPHPPLNLPGSPPRYALDCLEEGRGVVEITEYGELSTVRWLDTVDVWYRCGGRYEVFKGGGMPNAYEIPRFHLERGE